MIWAILLLLLFSAVVVLGVLYVKDSRMEAESKAKILLIVGVLLGLSLTISAFK